MSDKTQLALNALQLYFAEKNISTDKSQKLIGFLREEKWNKYQKRRKKWFPDYESFVEKMAAERLKKIRQQQTTLATLLKKVNTETTQAIGAINKKQEACKVALPIVQETLVGCQQQADRATEQLKIFGKLGKAFEKRVARERTAKAKLTKLQSSAEAAHQQAQAARVLVDDKLQATEKAKNELIESSAQLAAALKETNKLADEGKAADAILADHRKSLEALQRKRKNEEAVLQSKLAEEMAADIPVDPLARGLQALATTQKTLKDAVTRYRAGNVLQRNESALKRIRKALQRANKHWLKVAPAEALEFFDPTPHYAYYSNIWLYPTADPQVKGVAQDPFLLVSLEKGYVLVQKKGDLVKLSEGGWCRWDALLTQEEKERLDYLNAYTEFLTTQYRAQERLKGQAKLERIRGVLAQAQQVIRRFNKGNPQPLGALEPEPVYREDAQPVTSPHELIGPLRPWIALTESKIDRVDQEAEENLNAGSWYSNTDWNTLLGVPQYRTQSDNLISPEATCAPTTFTMMAERAGWSRADIITAIEQRFKDLGGGDPAGRWKSEGQRFLQWVDDHAGGKNYRKVRGGKMAKAKYEKLAANFRQAAQFEDLTIFYHYLLGKNTYLSINSSEHHNLRLQQGLENDGDFRKQGSYTYKKIDNLADDLAARKLVKEHLDRGNVIMFSINHKGAKQGTHNYFIQSINSEGFVIDDPYGQGNPDYVRSKNVASDLYKGKDQSKHRNSYPFKNKPDFDLGRQDFSMVAGQSLEENESRGESSLLSWRMMMASNWRIINYVVVWEKRSR